MTVTTPPLIEALLNPARYPQPVERVELVETHISWVLLTGRFAYKIKKPVDLGFLDFTTLERRRFYCHEELRLNRRLAPELYLEVLPITGSPEDPRIGGPGEPIEYALKMVQFPQQARLDKVLERNELLPSHCDALADEVARFHAECAIARLDSPFGTWERVRGPVADCLRQLEERVREPDERAKLKLLADWTDQEHASRRAAFERRKAAGFIRECHGDLHLANLALLGDRVTLFDCLEFSEPLRWIDVMSDVGFAVMDLVDRGRPALAWRLLNAYVELAGDHAGVAVLSYYLVYRALVRATVAAIRGEQPDLAPDVSKKQAEDCRGYLDLAATFAHRERPALIITHGLSGSGKSTHTQSLLESLGALRLRSDVERKRLFGLGPRDRTPADQVARLYSADASRATYERLLELARAVLEAGWPMIVDATFLKRAHREPFRELARRMNLPFAILDIRAPQEVLRQRVAARLAKGHDPSEATLEVLEQQLLALEPLTSNERSATIAIDAHHPFSPDTLRERVLRMLPSA